MSTHRTNLTPAFAGLVMLMLSAGSVHAQQPVIRGTIIIQQNGQQRVIQIQQNGQPRLVPMGQPGVFRRAGIQQQVQEAPVYPEAPPLPSRPPIAEEKLARLIMDLSSDDFRERVEATRELKTGGVETVRKLGEVLRSDSAEASRRAFAIIEELFLCEDELASQAADDILSTLAEAEESPLAARAAEILHEHALLRTQRATLELEVLGAHIEYRNDIFEIDDQTGDLLPKIGLLRFDHKWRGGVKGLKLLSRIEGIGTDLSQIYLVLNCPVSRDDFFTAVKTWAPRIDPEKINIRGEAQLGIRYDSNYFSTTPGVYVTDTPPGFAAAEAGIQAGDLLTRINKTEVAIPKDLTTELEKFEPGNEVEITVKRNLGTESETELTLKVTLKGWTEADQMTKPRPINLPQRVKAPAIPPRPE